VVSGAFWWRKVIAAVKAFVEDIHLITSPATRTILPFPHVIRFQCVHLREEAHDASLRPLVVALLRPLVAAWVLRPSVVA